MKWPITLEYSVSVYLHMFYLILEHFCKLNVAQVSFFLGYKWKVIKPKPQSKLRHSILANLDEFLSALKHVVYFFFPHNLSLNIIMRNTICIIVNHSTANSTLLIYSSLSLYIYDQSWLVENRSIKSTKKYVQVCIFCLAISNEKTKCEFGLAMP